MESIENWVFINPETYVEDEVNLVLNQILTEYAKSLELDNNLSLLAYSERENTKKFFEKIIDQNVYFTQDHLKLRKFIMDWYASNKTQITKARKSTDLNILTSEELNEFMISLGFPYPRNIISRSNRIQFLSNLIKNYQKKGTSETIANIISLYGLRNVLISEWWIRYDRRRAVGKKYFARSNIVHPKISRFNKALETEKSYEEFIKNNPHWQLSYDELDDYFETDNIPISLPSITNVISIETHSNLVELELAASVFQRKIQETLDFWIGYSCIPIKVPGLNVSETIYTGLYNSPPKYLEAREHRRPEDLGNIFAENNIYLVGPDPTGAWENQGFEKKLVRYIAPDVLEDPEDLDETTELPGTWELVDISNPYWSVFTTHDSDLNADSLLVLDKTTGNWNVYKSFKKDAILQITWYKASHNSTIVYNGEKWVDLKGQIDYKFFHNRNENIFRDIPLNSFTSLYSILEIQLALSYLHQGSYTRDTSKRHFNYSGLSTPLDTGYIKDYVFPFKPPLRNDIDSLYYADSAYSVITEEYKNLVFDKDKLTPDNSIVTFRHNVTNTTPRKIQNEKKQKFLDNFTQKNNYASNLNLKAQIDAEVYLEAINPDFLKEINQLLESDDRSLLLENIMIDFENYVVNTMQLIESPFAYIQNGGEFLNKKLLPVLDFFKPFRVRLLDFLTKFEIYNPLMDSLLIDAEIHEFHIHELVVEKPFPRNLSTDDTFSYAPGTTIPVLDYLLGHGLATEDYAVIQLEHIINEPSFSPLDNDTNYSESDLSMKDAFFIEVTEGGDLIYNYKLDEGLVVFDSTSNPGEEDEIIPVDE